ncbi:uncharacterized protein LOC121736728 [Aricia agestis]|uniref:uncharacterized protein LOC121736728 n=1 Tax=Aricia agestis TaxID=91739 RepID=UPI001C2047FB|nr:uncharacterized protein LOC121736728 [Aricia agestis]
MAHRCQNWRCLNNVFRPNEKYDTIVVGMGAAGVKAAATLAKAGRRVLGLEADDRIGGRIHTVAFEDGVIEIGAEWIHGTVNNSVYDAAAQNNVSTEEQSLTNEVFRSDGSYGDRDLFNELIEFCEETIEESGDAPEPLGQFVTARLMEYLEENHPDVLKDQDFITEFLEVMNLYTDNDQASNDWNDITATTTYEVLEGHYHTSWHKHGYNTFFEILLNEYNDGPGLPSLDIKLNKEVTQIKWPKDSTEDVEVVCKDGETFTADNVIVTVSLGVLKERYSELFSPSLPQEKIEAIQIISIGIVDKIIIKFDKAWWTSIPYTYMFFLWKGEDKQQVSDEDYWTTRIFACSISLGSQNTLTLWTSGEVGKLVETLPEDVVLEKSVALLRQFIGNFTIPDPIGMIRSTWYSNPFTRGSYSYDSLAMLQHPDARSVLRQPLLDAAGTPKVLFAGEATDLTHFSTVHGASDSGYREAMRLLSASKIYSALGLYLSILNKNDLHDLHLTSSITVYIIICLEHPRVFIRMKGSVHLVVTLAWLGGALCLPTEKYDTIVVGMGAAGVTAAATLAKADRRVLGLEADDRIGGRVKTVPFGDGVVEVGAEWIHGTVNSRVYDAAVRSNVTTLEQNLASEVFRSDGTFVDRELFNELIKFSIEIVENSTGDPKPLGQYITGKVMEYLENNHPDILKDKDYVHELLEILNLFMNNHEASNDWNDVSTHTSYEFLEGHLHTSWHKHGYKTFFEILLNKYNNGAGLPSLDIKLNKEVMQIKWPKDSSGNVEVVCRDGERFTADNVIVTVSLGVLKERFSSLFDPPLPQNKIDMIKIMSMGVMDKIILRFDEPWWKAMPYGFMFFLWKGDDKKKVSKEDYWTTRIFGASTPMGSDQALTLWTSGEVAKSVEILPEDVVKAKAVELLKKFVGANFTVPDPTEMIRSTWFSNPYTRGSYTFDNIEMLQHPDARKILREPLLDSAGTPKVLFAGEATDLTHYSTVHGASGSGYREAMRLLPKCGVLFRRNK